MAHEINAQQWAEVEKIRKFWTEAQTTQVDDNQIREAVNRFWRRMGFQPPRVVVTDSPLEALYEGARIVNGRKDVSLTQVREVPRLVLIWWSAWAGWFEAAKDVFGVKFDEAEYDLFREFFYSVQFVVPYDELCVVGRKPNKIVWDGERLHSETGPVIEWQDGYRIWAIEGVHVDEQIVMRPETQTIKDIADETNEERRRIRIDRFGWMRYLEESDSKVIDMNRNDIEATVEILADTPLGQRLITHCPSTGRRYSLSLPGDRVKTCEEAQRRLWGDKDVYIIGRT